MRSILGIAVLLASGWGAYMLLRALDEITDDILETVFVTLGIALCTMLGFWAGFSILFGG